MCPSYSPALLLLAYIVAVTVLHTTLLLAERIRGAQPSDGHTWVVGGALSMGVGLWSMQLIASIASPLHIDVPRPGGWLLASLACALATGLATMQTLRRRAGTLAALAPCGLLVGVASTAMHQASLAAMATQPLGALRPVPFAAAAALAAAAATVIMWGAIRVGAGRRDRVTGLRLAIALALALAILAAQVLRLWAQAGPAEPDCLVDPHGHPAAVLLAVAGFGISMLLATVLLSWNEARLTDALTRSAGSLREANRALEQRVRERTVTLAREEARKDAILRATLDCIVTMDAQGRIVEVNPQAEKTFGYRRDEMLGRSLEETIVPHRYRSAHGAGLRRLVATGQSRIVGQRLELSALRRSGEEFPVELAVAAVEVGGEHFFTAHMRDITERKRAEQELRDAMDAAQAGSQAKSAFLATMSHEIRTPMNAVIGMLELLGLTRLDAEQRALLSTVRESSRMLLAQIDDILDFSKIEAGKLEIVREPCALGELVRATAALFAGVAAAKGLRLDIRVDAALWDAHQVDAVRLRQVLANFLSNAVKFTPAGAVTLGVEVAQTTEAAQQLRFVVHDTGIGMDAALRARLFEPFEQGDSRINRRFGGTGLGLAICSRLVGLMGGSIEVTSAERLGTRIELTLSAERADAGAPAATPPDASGEAGWTRLDGQPGLAVRLLVVDDHPVNLRLLGQQLRVLGLEADLAASGAEALASWRRLAHPLVITDCQMPEMDGYALARAIREEARRTGAAQPRIVAFTADSRREAVDECLRAGMDDYLAKPVELAALHAKLVRWLGDSPQPGSAPAAAAGGAVAAGDEAAAAGDAAAVGEATVDNAAAGGRVAAGAATAGGDASLFDHGRLGEICSSAAALQALMAEFAAACRADAAALQAARDHGDRGAIGRVAHRLCGAARTMGAARLAGASERLERAAGRPDAAGLHAALEAVTPELDRVLAETGRLREAVHG